MEIIKLWDGKTEKVKRMYKLRGKLNTFKLNRRRKKEEKEDRRIAKYLRI